MARYAIHYAGALEIHRGPRVTIIGAGWAACCSGPRARKIRALGHHTYDRSKVTCKTCLTRMAEADPDDRVE